MSKEQVPQEEVEQEQVEEKKPAKRSKKVQEEVAEVTAFLGDDEQSQEDQLEAARRDALRNHNVDQQIND